MNVYLSKAFTRLARREELTDVHICQAVAEMNAGLIDANLGAGLFKKRIAMPGQGKCGSWRALLGFQAGKKAFLLYLFPKNSRGNIEDDEMKGIEAPDKILSRIEAQRNQNSIAMWRVKRGEL